MATPLEKLKDLAHLRTEASWPMDYEHMTKLITLSDDSILYYSSGPACFGEESIQFKRFDSQAELEQYQDNPMMGDDKKRK